jgi:hypothetical protein
MWCKMSMLFSRTEEAEKFWSILPPKQVEQKVIAFPAAS